MKQLAQKFNVSSTIIQNINLGKTYHNDNLTYPLRKPKTGSRKLSNDQVQQIIKEIINNPKKSLAQIGREFKVSSKTISGINCGIIYKQKDIIYPIRLSLMLYRLSPHRESRNAIDTHFEMGILYLIIQ